MENIKVDLTKRLVSKFAVQMQMCAGSDTAVVKKMQQINSPDVKSHLKQDLIWKLS